MLKMNIQLFARKKNALRKHEVAEFEGYDPETGLAISVVAGSYKHLGKWVTTMADDTQEETETGGDYAGDGTPTTEVVSISERWTSAGTYDAQDAAQALIASKKREIGDGRKVWHKITQTDGKVFEGLATLTDIRAGSGDATAFEEFSATINFDTIPVESGPVGG